LRKHIESTHPVAAVTEVEPEAAVEAAVDVESEVGSAVTEVVANRHNPWATVHFPAGKSAEPSDGMLQEVAQIYAWQQLDSERFRSNQGALFGRLDPHRTLTIAMNCDSVFVELFENWVASCSHAKLDNRHRTVVFVTDRPAMERVEALGYVAYFDEQSAFLASMKPSGQYGDAPWSHYMFHQNWIIQELLQLPTDLLFQDVDLVWKADPVPILTAGADHGFDVQAMYDGPNPLFQPLYANSGFMYLRPRPFLRHFWDEVYARHDMVRYYRSQQVPLNVQLAAYAHRGLRVHVLDEDRFANGHLYCGPRTAPPNPMVVHNSWTHDLAEKMARYHEHDLWFL